ncbi:YeeE/YedE thiosulfate transporter family protein [Psychrobium sp. 1_MG-2023]|uniref:YeeE/YedE thiosulfate transporter family protein n=1 Tax=Psychrobium sp. 1_MG-2023 TaxID=3062624 RepID=UPI000C33DE8E|nr:YeeE/YedE thiosulfate transporter family protein [Psychrobium sp. 1_MG-2023]MDP2562905.1 YeeE/YedE thiosulfate transporter family protein [Psychrobium sp. 1_MG-2023]PKF54705.1 hypothetical protein CW748_15730 [Alteromonadales bacterium alter-6D02]
MTLLITSLVLLMVLGYLAQTTGLCLVRGVKETIAGRPLFLLAILFSGSFSWLAMLVAKWYEVESSLIATSVHWSVIVGGVLFGCGAAFNQGCGVSTISKLARGQLVMIATIGGWFIGWLLLTLFIRDATSTNSLLHIYWDDYWHHGMLIAFSFLMLVVCWRLNTEDKKMWLSMLTIGLMASLVFLYQVKWAPSSLLKDLSSAMLFYIPFPENERYLLLASLLVGMVLAAVKTKAFKVNKGHGLGYIKHLIAGVLMGVGAALAGGGNDSQLLLALPALSPAGLSAVLSMLFGIYVVQRVSHLLKKAVND